MTKAIGGADEFAQSLARTACAQIVYATAEQISAKRPAKAAGSARPVKPVTPQTVHLTEGVASSLADIAHAFIEHVGRLANARTELAGRTKSSFPDVIGAIRSLSSITGSDMRDLARYMAVTEVPFPYTVPQFPVMPRHSKKADGVFIGDHGDARKRTYIDAWMPPLPSKHTYVETPIYVNNGARKRTAAEMGEQRRRVGNTLARLKEAQGRSDDTQHVLAAAAAAAPENPFLAPPTVGTSRIYDEDMAGDARDLTERDDALTADALDSNADVVEVAKSSGSDMKKAKIERILTDAERNATTAISSTPTS